jgi:hypothetical protein
MARKWWAVRARVQAESLQEALQTVRRQGVMPENVEQINDLGTFEYGTAAEAASPWKPPATAPKDGTLFIAYDKNIQLVEKARWDNEQRTFVNDVGDEEVKFTQWLELPD